MKKTRLYDANLSRRSVLQRAAAGLTLACVGGPAFAAKKPRPQADVGYQDHPNGSERCDNCEPFIPPNKCRTVEGVVAPEGWCQIYVQK